MGEVLLGDRLDQRLVELARLGDRQLQLSACVVEATEVAVQGAEVDPLAQLAERVTARRQQLQRRLVLLEGGGEVATLVEDRSALGPQPPAHALGKPGLGHVEDVQRVLQLALEGDDERQRHGDVRRR